MGFEYNNSIPTVLARIEDARRYAFLVEGIEGCINSLAGCLFLVEIKFCNKNGENKFTEEQKRAIQITVSNHNKLKNIEEELKNPIFEI